MGALDASSTYCIILSHRENISAIDGRKQLCFAAWEGWPSLDEGCATCLNHFIEGSYWSARDISERRDLLRFQVQMTDARQSAVLCDVRCIVCQFWAIRASGVRISRHGSRSKEMLLVALLKGRSHANLKVSDGRAKMVLRLMSRS
jgi:hypothetical protein